MARVKHPTNWPENGTTDDWPLRPPAVAMDIKRLGSLHQSRLSFMRLLMRRMMSEHWQIAPNRMDLDEHGYGTVVYTLTAGGNTYSYVLFSQYLADDERNDRVIADKWDVTMALCMGLVDDADLADLRDNVPLQEGGRYNARVLVLSRGNKSMRNFAYVVNELAAGRQPSVSQLAQVGYLYRTTAVYGSGKFGMADWEKVHMCCPEFAYPFAAEMFNCYMLRHFSIAQAEHLAKIQAPESAVQMAPEVQRYLGIGNSTGLGMAPYLIRHPKLIAQWVLTREKALARAIYGGAVDAEHENHLAHVLAKAQQHVCETSVPDVTQTERNQTLINELADLQSWLANQQPAYHQANRDWSVLVQRVAQRMSLETQEMINSALLELYPQWGDELVYPCVKELYLGQPAMTLGALKQLIERQYDWALEYDFSQSEANQHFWYRSQEKMEPRLGERFSEPGAEWEMPLPIARQVRACYDELTDFIEHHDSGLPVAFMLAQVPHLAAIVRRMQSMADECYGEIRVNLAAKDVLPLDLLRCKLSFFGVSKFDPKSRLWVRNTMFQGAPIVADIGQPFTDDWYFPVAPAQ